MIDALLGRITWRAVVIVGLALAVALEALAIRALWHRWQAEAARRAEAEGRYAAFVSEVEEKGRRAQAEYERRIKEIKDANDAVRADNARLRAVIARLRERPPERPDGSAVPTTTCSPESSDRPSGEWVPLADYRALEARAAEDALRLQLWEEWRLRHGFPVED